MRGDLAGAWSWLASVSYSGKYWESKSRRNSRKRPRMGMLDDMEDLLVFQEVLNEMIQRQMIQTGQKLVEDGGDNIVRIIQRELELAVNDRLSGNNMASISHHRLVRLRRESGIPDDLIRKPKNRLTYCLPTPYLTHLTWLTPLHNGVGLGRLARLAGGEGSEEKRTDIDTTRLPVGSLGETKENE